MDGDERSQFSINDIQAAWKRTKEEAEMVDVMEFGILWDGAIAALLDTLREGDWQPLEKAQAGRGVE